MPPGAGIFYLLGVLLIELPLAAIRSIFRLLFFVLRRVFGVFRLRQFWRAVPLDRKCQFRATVGAFVLVVLGGGILCDAIPCSNWTEVEVYGGIAAFALLYLVVGLCCSRWAFDPMSVFYWSALALSCGGLLFYVGA